MKSQAIAAGPEKPTALAAIAPPSVSLLEVVRDCPPKEARTRITELKAELEIFLTREPENYDALVLLGELNLRVGLSREAQALLYRASLQQPPSWPAFQRTSYLLRRAEEQRSKAFDRVGGSAPPRFLRSAASAIWACAQSVIGKKTQSVEVSS